MALGPKEMGEAIIANLQSKTGKDLGAWLEVADTAGTSDKKVLTAFLKERGLGQFQAQTVVMKYLDENPYDAVADVENLFRDYPEQLKIMNAINAQILKRYGLVEKPCKGYVPLYNSKRTIELSYKPTAKGLYIGLVGHEFPFDVVPHTASLGGSERMRYGIYVDDSATALEKLARIL